MSRGGKPSVTPPAAAGTRSGLVISVISFSLKGGLPGEADLIFDTRFLRNPYHRPELRALSGRDQQVAEFVAADPQFPEFLHWLTGILTRLFLRFEEQGKSTLTLALGCTGGRHRSVFVAEKVASWLREQGQSVSLLHRDIKRDVVHSDGQPESAMKDFS